MFSLFKKKSEEKILEEKYRRLMEEGYKLQSISRSDSDAKYLEADNILKKLDTLKSNKLL